MKIEKFEAGRKTSKSCNEVKVSKFKFATKP